MVIRWEMEGVYAAYVGGGLLLVDICIYFYFDQYFQLI